MEIELPNNQPNVPIVHIDSIFGTDHNSVKTFVNKIFRKESYDANSREEGDNSSKHSMESVEIHSKGSNASLGNAASSNKDSNTSKLSTAAKRRKSTSTKLKDGKEKKRSRCTVM
jgi:hypothetical protein